MKEKELRLAISYFGGVSLAVYQHGINREILNLIRASKIFHGNIEGRSRHSVEFHDHYPSEPAASTGDVYLRFLSSLGDHVSLHVIIDVIAGTSAGAINGIALGRALANDLDLTPLTGLWLQEADMTKLLAPEARAKLWSKWYIRPIVHPLVGRLKREGLLPSHIDPELAERLSVFLRSRWFKPPLDGRHFTALLLDGLEAMETTATSARSLMPDDTRLDLLITTTDFGGVNRSISIHDPPVLQEREHRHLFRFCYEHRKTGHRHSDFDLDSLPSLAFAARASASYPGAFPPAQISEIDDLLRSRYQPWPARTRFLAANFNAYHSQNLDPEAAVLLDGGVLDNKPIMATLEAIHGHAAYREVDRRLVFVDPHSGMERSSGNSGVPGFFTTLRAALSDLPRNDPIYRGLAEISRFNRTTRRLKEAIASARPQIEEMVASSTAGRVRESDVTTEELREWRLNSNRLLIASPIIFSASIRSLVLDALDFVAGLIDAACGFAKSSMDAQRVEDAIERWARDYNILSNTYDLPDNIKETAQMTAAAQMFINFGLVYKKRRLNFVLSEVNNLYDETKRSEDLDLLKIKLHKIVDGLSIYDDGAFLSDHAVAICRRLFGANSGPSEAPHAPSDAEIADLIKRLSLECALDRANDETDAVLSSALVLDLEPRCRSAILTAYLGYFYWDVLVRPVADALSLETGPIAEILIDRICPDDAVSLASSTSTGVLLGGAFRGFGGFLSRATRENDYLWGRLHAVDRLLDILASTAPAHTAAIDMRALKKQAFERVLDEEAGRLSRIPAVFLRVREAVASF